MIMVPQRGPGPPFWFPWGGSRPSFWASEGPMWPHSAPQDDLWRSLVIILGVIWKPTSVKFGVDFWCVFGMVCWMVLQWFCPCFGRLFGAKTMTKRQREDLWKCLFYLSNIAVFVVCGLHSVFQMERKTEFDSELKENSVLWSFGVRFESHSASEIDEKE